ncbi:MAG: hypothetical protein ACI8WP_001221 [Flavobacteriaceae bacterium]|jgi:hypothetical protein
MPVFVAQRINTGIYAITVIPVSVAQRGNTGIFFADGVFFIMKIRYLGSFRSSKIGMTNTRLNTFLTKNLTNFKLCDLKVDIST